MNEADQFSAAAPNWRLIQGVKEKIVKNERCDCCQKNSIALPDGVILIGWKVCQECQESDEEYKELMKKKNDLPESEYWGHAVMFFALRSAK